MIGIEELDGVDWIASPSTGGESLLGLWPGFGVTTPTVPPNLARVLPNGVQRFASDTATDLTFGAPYVAGPACHRRRQKSVTMEPHEVR